MTTMVPVCVKICWKARLLGEFVRMADGKCSVRSTERLSEVDRRVLGLYGHVLAHAVGPHGQLPSEEKLTEGTIVLGVPLDMLGAFYAWPDEELGRVLHVPASMVFERRLMLLRADEHGRRIDPEALRGGTA